MRNFLVLNCLDPFRDFTTVWSLFRKTKSESIDQISYQSVPDNTLTGIINSIWLNFKLLYL